MTYNNEDANDRLIDYTPMCRDSGSSCVVVAYRLNSSEISSEDTDSSHFVSCKVVWCENYL